MAAQVIPPPPDAEIPSPPDYVPPKADGRSVLGGALADTFGMTDRPGAKSLLKPGEKGYQTPLDVLLRPGQSGSEFPGQETFERVASAAISSVPIMKAGQLAAKVAPAAMATAAPYIGRIAASGAKGAAEGAYQGEEGMGAWWGALIDAAVAAGVEGVAGAAGAARIPFTGIGLKSMGAPVRAFDWATGAPAKALGMIRDRLTQVAGGNAAALANVRALEVPAMGPGKLSVEAAVEKLATMTGDAYRLARAQLIRQLNKFDKLALPADVNPRAGATFREFTSKERFPPSLTAKAAEGTRKVITGEPGRALADAAATQDLEGGVPVGALAVPAAQSFGGAAMRLFR